MALNEITKNRLKLYGILKQYKKTALDHEAAVVGDIIEQIKKDDNKHFLSFEPNGTVTYASSAALKYEKDKRVKTTIGRYVRRQMNVPATKLGDTSLSRFSDFVNQKIMEADADKDINILSGKDIQDFYLEAHKNCSSCMTGAYHSNRIKFYADNPDKIKLVTTRDKRGRALLWVTDTGEKVLDRIYGAGINTIIAWANRHKVLYLYRNDPKTGLNKDIEKIRKLKVTVQYKTRCFPSIDNFRYGKIKDVKNIKSSDTIVITANPMFGNVILTSGTGGFSIVPQCENCGESLNNGSYYTPKNILHCKKCFDKKYARCNICGVEQEKENMRNVKNKLQNILGITSVCKVCNNKQKKDVNYNYLYECLSCRKTFRLQDKCIPCNYFGRDRRYSNYRWCVCFKCIKDNA